MLTFRLTRNLNIHIYIYITAAAKEKKAEKRRGELKHLKSCENFLNFIAGVQICLPKLFLFC